ncbi:MAG: N-acetyl-gamma-glutamyl-phosphate reductase [Desulfobacterales bacterium]|nr:MAG: N-acetyl-gamma-glutamyl-phosphate reductase [Desulfobacterales bacterium]
MLKVGVVGATGYAGAELVRILAGHPAAELTVLTSRQYAGVKFDEIYPSMAGIVGLVCEELAIDQVCGQADFIFVALPHKLPMALVPEILKHGKRVIDLSADFRFKNVAAYEAAYQPHSAQELLAQTVYGLSEIYFEEIQSAMLVGNPGCYPTSVLLPLIPLLQKDLLEVDSLIADSKSGVSGAGRSPVLTTHFCEVNESYKPYKVAVHRHAPEMEEILSREAGQPVRITFVPHLVPMTRGMLTTIYAKPRLGLSAADISDCLAAFYSGRPFVRLRPEGKPPDTLHVRGTNYCDLGFKFDARNNRVILMSAIDNLVKGAAGQAVQNMNIMLGLDETTGLAQVPFPV